MSSADESLSWGSIVREVAVVVVRRPHLFVLLPWILVTSSSIAIWVLAGLGTFRWLMPVRFDFAGGWLAHGITLLVPLIFAILVTSPLIALADPTHTSDRRSRPVTLGWTVRRVLENTAISTIIAVSVIALVPAVIILPMSLMGLATGKSLLSLLVFLAFSALACGLAWILSTLSVALPVAAFEGRGLGSLRRSCQLTRGRRWRIAPLVGPLVALVALLWLYIAEAVAPPSCPSCTFGGPVTASERLIDIGGRSLALAIGLGIAMVMMTRIFRRLTELNGELAGGAVQGSASPVRRAT